MASSDRIRETDTSYVEDGGGVWWLETVACVYAVDNDATATETGRQRRQFTNLPAGVTRPSESIDIHGNVTGSTTHVDPAVKLVTETVDTPDSNVDMVTITRNGLVQSSTSATDVTHTYGCDGLGRRVEVVDPRTGTSTTHYNDAGQVEWVENAHGDRTTYAYDPDSGRLASVANADTVAKLTYYAYTDRGQTTRVWGARARSRMASGHGRSSTMPRFRSRARCSTCRAAGGMSRC